MKSIIKEFIVRLRQSADANVCGVISESWSADAEYEFVFNWEGLAADLLSMASN